MNYQEKNKWTAAQLNYLISNYQTMKDEEIANALNRTVKSVRQKRARLKLAKVNGRGLCAARAGNATYRGQVGKRLIKATPQNTQKPSSDTPPSDPEQHQN